MANTRLSTVRCECGGILEVSKGPLLGGSPVLRCTACGRLFVAQVIQEPYDDGRRAVLGGGCETGSDIPGGGAN